jgi:hypothetical protein
MLFKVCSQCLPIAGILGWANYIVAHVNNFAITIPDRI